MAIYTNENILKEFVQSCIDTDAVHNKKTIKAFKHRPDVTSFKYKTIFEFDGPTHYLNFKGRGGALQVLADIEQEKWCASNEWKIVRIPYFVQLSNDVCNQIVSFVTNTPNANCGFNIDYPHGFIDKLAPLPADFCVLGVQRFNEQCENFGKTVFADICKSLKDKKEHLPLEAIVPQNICCNVLNTI